MTDGFSPRAAASANCCAASGPRPTAAAASVHVRRKSRLETAASIIGSPSIDGGSSNAGATRGGVNQAQLHRHGTYTADSPEALPDSR
jgi:hypothetical protein